MVDADSGIFFAPLTGADVARVPIDVLPDRLGWGLERYSQVGPYADLRLESAESLREASGGDTDEIDFGRDLLMLEPLLDGALRLDAPSPAGMGVWPWDKALTDGANGPDGGIAPVEKKAKRMARRLFPEDEEDDLPRRRAEADPHALLRAADLVEAIARMRAWEDKTPEGPRRGRLVSLRVDLLRRLTQERRYDAGLDALLPPAKMLSESDARSLRARASTPVFGETKMAADGTVADVVRIERTSAAENPYLRALSEAESRLDEPLAENPAAPGLPGEPPARLATVQAEAAKAVAAALKAPEGKSTERAVARARKLFAEEAALTGGRPGTPETLALRRTLSERHPPVAPKPAPDALVGARGVTEVPVFSSRGDKARIVTGVPAGAALVATGPEKDGFVPVSVAGRKGWVRADLVRRADSPQAAWPQPLTPPERLAPLPKTAGRPAPRPFPAPAGGPVALGQVLVSAAGDAPTGETAHALSVALAALPDVLGSRMRGRPLRTQGQAELSLVLDVPESAKDPKIRGRILADQLADALVRAGVASVGTLKIDLKVRNKGPEVATSPDGVLGRLTAGDTDGVARALAAEQRTLDAATRSRLASFFGHDFGDVTVFAGPMSGALARSLSAEAFTHGKMVFFDPKHFRPDTAQGEALLAHELAHTRQSEQERRDAKHKEAEALATEAHYLDWLSPGGAPLARDLEDRLAAESPDAAAAGDSGAAGKGVSRATQGRSLEKSEGPRADVAKFEERVEAVLERVHELMGDRGDFEADRLGGLIRAGIVRL